MAEATAPRTPSLLHRVLLGVFLLMILGGVTVTAVSWLNGRQAAWKAYDRILLGAANDIAESIRVQGGAPVVDLPISAFQLLAQAPDDRIAYAVRGPDGGLLTGFADAPPEAPDAARSPGPAFFDAPMQGEAARYVQITRRFAERDFSGEVRVIVGQTQMARRDMAISLMVDALVPMGLAGAALMLVSYLVVLSAVRPLEAIAEDLAVRDPYDLTQMPTDRMPREMQVILVAMNRFMMRLDRQMDSMRHLISDTAHQLRTPVAAIRVQAETALEDTDPERRARALARLVDRTRGLGALLDQMLNRALVIHRTDSVPRTALDLREVALEVVDTRDHEVLAPGAEVRLDIGPDPVRVMGDEFSLTQAARNLLSNALRHGQAPVRIGVTREGATASLWVEDVGPGPGPELMAQLGQRFARTVHSREDSAGLGLSIVKAVATAFDGHLVMEQRDTGFRAALTLPALPPEEDSP